MSASTDRFRALFEPRGVLVAGASTHPGKFGFVSLHNILAAGYEGKVFGTNRDGAEVLGVQTVADVAELPDGEIDLVFVCTPAAANPDLLRACAKKGITAAFIASAGYGEAGEEGRRAQADLVALADELGILLAGPNGQGVVSPPAKLCAQIVAPYPPAGHIAIASQSGNFVSSFENYARLTGVGVSRAVSAGNAAAVGVVDYLEYYADDPETRVSLAYLESVGDGRAFYERLRSLAERKPIVLVKGGATAGGQRAAASHTGALASDDAVLAQLEGVGRGGELLERVRDVSIDAGRRGREQDNRPDGRDDSLRLWQFGWAVQPGECVVLRSGAARWRLRRDERARLRLGQRGEEPRYGGLRAAPLRRRSSPALAAPSTRGWS